MMSLARKIPAAHAHVKSGQWQRNKYQGTQVGGEDFGNRWPWSNRRTVASRAIAMEMNVLGFDPYFSSQTALDGKVR